jgi:hypothetical protein
MPLRFENSPCVHAPLGLYSHTVCVPEASTIAEQADSNTSAHIVVQPLLRYSSQR